MAIKRKLTPVDVSETTDAAAADTAASVDAVKKKTTSAVALARPAAEETAEGTFGAVKEKTGAVVAATKEKLAKAGDWGKLRLAQAKQSVDEVKTFQEETLNDVLAAGTAAAQGLKSARGVLAETLESASDEQVTATREFLKLRSLSDILGFQEKYRRLTLDLYLDHNRKIAQVAADTFSQTFAPLAARASLVAGEIDKRRAGPS